MILDIILLKNLDRTLNMKWFIILCIVTLTLLFRFLRDWKENTRHYSDPMMNTMLLIFTIYCVILVLDFTLKVIEFYCLGEFFKKINSEWANRDTTKLFNINNFVIMGKMFILIFPYKGLQWTLHGSQWVILSKLFWILIDFKYYFFFDRNFIFMDTDMKTGKLKKRRYSKKTFEEVYNFSRKQSNQFNECFKERIISLSKELAQERFYPFVDRWELYNLTRKLSSSLIDFEKIVNKLHTDLMADNIYEIASNTLKELQEKQDNCQKNIIDFSNKYNELYNDIDILKIVQEMKDNGLLR